MTRGSVPSEAQVLRILLVGAEAGQRFDDTRDCTCGDDPDGPYWCWYRLDPAEQNLRRLDYVLAAVEMDLVDTWLGVNDA